MLPYQERVIAEKAELETKLTKLAAFTKTPDFYALPKTDQRLIWEQESAMATYLRVLNDRIERFS